MATPHHRPDAPPPAPNSLFSPATPPREFPVTALSIAAVAILILVAVLVLLGRRHAVTASPNTMQAAAAYSPKLAITNVAMSESTSFSGGKSTYLDGHIANHGSAIVTGITLQVIFANNEAMPPEIETTPMRLIRMREPYIDTQSISAAPLAPGAEADFRLIFEKLQPNWNGQQPEIHITNVSTK